MYPQFLIHLKKTVDFIKDIFILRKMPSSVLSSSSNDLITKGNSQSYKNISMQSLTRAPTKHKKYERFQMRTLVLLFKDPEEEHQYCCSIFFSPVVVFDLTLLYVLRNQIDRLQCFMKLLFLLLLRYYPFENRKIRKSIFEIPPPPPIAYFS